MKRQKDSLESEGPAHKKRKSTEQEVEELATIFGIPNLPNFFFKLVPERTRTEIVEDYRDFGSDLNAADYQDLVEKAKKEFERQESWNKTSAALGKSEYLAGGIADGDLVVIFMAIGNGDCIFIRTPGGEVIVIDCGTRARLDKEGKYRKHIGDVLKAHFLKPGKSSESKANLYALILTHPDKDHHNELVSIIEPAVGRIQHLFHSDELTKYNAEPPKAEGNEEPTPEAPGKKVETTPEMNTEQFLLSTSIVKNRVTINSQKVELATENLSGAPLPYVTNQGKKWIQILDETPNGNRCEIILLAAGVSAVSDTNREVNAPETRPGVTRPSRDRYQKLLKARRFGDDGNSGSIVTLIKTHGKKLLFCGDATYLTEIFLLQNHREAIKDVELAQIEHHGAGTAHAGGVYVETINPVFAVASSGEHGGDANPRWRAIQKYLGLKKLKPEDGGNQQQRPVHLKTGMEAHDFHCFEENKHLIGRKLWEPHQKKGLYSTRSNQDVCFVLKPSGELQLDSKKTTT
ncbi:MAG TPA: hypothetical protein VHU83_04070 [Bryobacteraceae bacterium]|jgi:beta-lactamase superfamily II metal-dependent hydrolase|nr:hypothetical protein [Bryobacteraceae bacterium]